MAMVLDIVMVLKNLNWYSEGKCLVDKLVVWQSHPVGEEL